MRSGLVFAAALLALAAGAALAQDVPKGDTRRGQRIFDAYGCHQCHGRQGQGSNAGSRLAPNPLPFPALESQLRRPRGRMPVYTRKVASDQDLADIYAYLISIPKAKTVAEIPLLAAVR